MQRISHLVFYDDFFKKPTNLFISGNCLPLIHGDFWYKNILVNSNGLTGIIDFELSCYVPRQVELFHFFYSKQCAKNYIDDGAEDYTELEFLDLLLAKIDSEYPDLRNSFNSKEFLVFSNTCQCFQDGKNHGIHIKKLKSFLIFLLLVNSFQKNNRLICILESPSGLG